MSRFYDDRPDTEVELPDDEDDGWPFDDAYEPWGYGGDGDDVLWASGGVA